MSTNAHFKAAARRLHAIQFVDSLATKFGAEYFSVSMSYREQVLGRPGSRIVHDIRDAASFDEQVIAEPKPDHWLRMDDVDHFLSESELSDMVHHGQPILTYTWTPTEVAGSSDEMSFSSLDGENFEFSGPGTDDFKHRLWNWSKECMSFTRTSFKLPGPAYWLIILMSVFLSSLVTLYRAQYFSESCTDVWVFGWKRFCKSNLVIDYPSWSYHRYFVEVSWLPYVVTETWWSMTRHVYWSELAQQAAILFTVLWLLMCLYVNGPSTVVARLFVRSLGEHRAVIAIVPVKRYDGWLCHLYNAHLFFSSPKRIKFQTLVYKETTYVVHEFMTSTPYVSMSKAGACVTHHFDGAAVDLVDAAETARTTSVTPGEASRLAKQEKIAPDMTQADFALLTCYIRARGTPDRTNVHVRQFQVATYSYGDDLDDVPVSRLRGAMRSTLPGRAYVPAKTLGIERRAVENRVTSHQTKPEPDPLTNVETGWAREFGLHILAANGGVLAVVKNYEEVLAHQKSPSAARLLAVAEMGKYCAQRVLSFIKLEAHATPKDGRVVSPVKPNEKERTAAFALGITTLFYQCAWYGFGKPGDVEQKVVTAAMASAARTNMASCLLTDFSRYDGRTRAVMHSVFQAVFRELVQEHNRPELATILRGMVNRKATTPHDVSYETGTSILSGIGLTSILGSTGNGFIAYSYLRRAKYTSGEAWSRLGVYAGDDGMTFDVVPALYAEEAKRYGHLLTVDVRAPLDRTLIQLGVSQDTITIKHHCLDFLARTWGPAVWDGDANSCTDVVRALSKFHLTTLDDTRYAMRLKALAYLVNDRNTPYLGLFLKKVAAPLPGESEIVLTSTTEHIPWLAHISLALDSRFTNTLHDWMIELLSLHDDIDWGLLDVWSASALSWAEPPTLAEPIDLPSEADGTRISVTTDTPSESSSTSSSSSLTSSTRSRSSRRSRKKTGARLKPARKPD
jgi:hypothetical protein